MPDETGLPTARAAVFHWRIQTNARFQIDLRSKRRLAIMRILNFFPGNEASTRQYSCHSSEMFVASEMSAFS
jgi:hypothetical protein